MTTRSIATASLGRREGQARECRTTQCVREVACYESSPPDAIEGFADAHGRNTPRFTEPDLLRLASRPLFALPGVRLILFDTAEYPVELAAGDLGIAVLADAGHVDLERRAAVWACATVFVRFLHATATGERPVFREAAIPFRIATDDIPLRVHGVVLHARPNTNRDRIEENVAPNLDGPSAIDLDIGQDISESLPLVFPNPEVVRLEHWVRFVRPSSLPIERGPCLLQFVKDVLESRSGAFPGKPWIRRRELLTRRHIFRLDDRGQLRPHLRNRAGQKGAARFATLDRDPLDVPVEPARNCLFATMWTRVVRPSLGCATAAWAA